MENKHIAKMTMFMFIFFVNTATASDTSSTSDFFNIIISIIGLAAIILFAVITSKGKNKHTNKPLGHKRTL